MSSSKKPPEQLAIPEKQLPAIEPKQPLDTVLDKLDGIMKLSNVMVRSGLLPQPINSPEKAAIILMKSVELGIGVMAGISHLYPVKGKVAIEGQLVLGLIQRVGGSWEILEESPKKVKVKFMRPGKPEFITEFGEEDAKRAGLLGKDVYKSYPTDMYFWRCVSRAGKRYFSDVTQGMVMADDIPDAGITMDNTGSIVIEEPGQDVDVITRAFRTDPTTGQYHPETNPVPGKTYFRHNGIMYKYTDKGWEAGFPPNETQIKNGEAEIVTRPEPQPQPQPVDIPSPPHTPKPATGVNGFDDDIF